MKQGAIGLGLLLWATTPLVEAQVQVLAGTEPPQVFSGEGRALRVLLQNSGAAPFDAEVRTRLYQTAVTTAVLLADTPWKRLQVLPGQTVVESASLAFPLVRSKTRFLVQWTDGSGRVLGSTDVLVYPPDLLKELRPLADAESLGIYDPFDQLKPLLAAAGVGYQDLEQGGFEHFGGKLAIVGPFPSRAGRTNRLVGKMLGLAEKGVAVVWMQPPQEEEKEPKPSFFTVPKGKGVVVVVEAPLVSDLAGNPQAQLNLLHFARLALRPEPPRLPPDTSQP